MKEQQTSELDFSFFMIPNPAFLFDIPEPIIHPPGIDPYSLIIMNPNSNPNPDNGFQSLPALDIDPSSVSYTQFIISTTRKTDLTVSEHAGGTLSEHVIESTTSYSPANSEVVAQKTMNDVTVTNIRSKDAHVICCDVCNISCDTKDILEQHKQGKRHKKNVQKLAVSSPIIQEPAKDVTLHQEPEEKKKKKQDELQTDASVDSSFFCGINQTIFTEHIEGGNQVTSGALATVQPSTDKAHKIWCEVCDVKCTSDKNFQKHILGKKHKKNLNKSSEKIVAPSSSPVASMATIPTSNPPRSLKSSEGNSVESEKLTVCLSTFIATTPPSTDLLEHANSSKGETVHLEELCKVRCRTNVMSSCKSGKKHMESEKIPDLSSTLPRNVELPKLEENKSTRCELCGISCSSYSELKKHILGKRHVKNVKNSGEIYGIGCGGSTEEDERCKRKANWESDDDNEEDRDRKKPKKMMMMMVEEERGALMSCKVCNVVCNSSMAFRDHCASQNHSAMVLKLVEIKPESEEVFFKLPTNLIVRVCPRDQLPDGSTGDRSLSSKFISIDKCSSITSRLWYYHNKAKDRVTYV